jgi:hypothetical protein
MVRMYRTRGSWVRIAAKARRGICEQDTLKFTAQGNHDKQNCLRHSPLTSVKKKFLNCRIYSIFHNIGTPPLKCSGTVQIHCHTYNITNQVSLANYQ